ncbi:PKD-like domain-containing protein [Flavobacterium sp. 5]|uniref:PKD-like domain-containing protein n=1 Tax=Flavobacterium sp. 5 TaxID=2035199 RepID=UPI000C2C493A|nr:PKD-like domain-containing protein [Flavobacterium sp. 5]PKB18339.1 hypothetical protein CLU82_3612 [Flavobacterium sp. 5]
MIKQLKKSKLKKTVAIYLAMMILLETFQPMQMYALTSGPTQPEFNSFTPIGTSDMVDLASGDFNYNIPIMDVGGYPLNLAYNSGATMDQEASWVGLGWNLNVGEISRQVRGLPDDFKGDKMTYENNLRDNVTIGTNFNVNVALFGVDIPISLGLGVQYNNYEGITFKPSFGVSYSLFDTTNVGFTLTGSTEEGATLSPTISIFGKVSEKGRFSSSLGVGVGIDLNNRKGLENMSISAFSNRNEKTLHTIGEGGDTSKSIGNGSVGGSISLNNTNNYTPTKRIAFDNINGTFNAGLGAEIFGGESDGRVIAYGSVQKINSKYKKREIGGYGYENSQYKNDLEGILDFNREKEQSTITKNTTALPVTNYTYDTYNIQGQGVSGMFRPFKSQITYLYNDKVTDYGTSVAGGAEWGLGNLVHVGANFEQTPSTGTTGKWSRNNNAIKAFTERTTDKNDALYEATTFKLIGELDVDNELERIYKTKMLGTRALRLKITGGGYNRKLEPTYVAKPISTLDPTQTELTITEPIKRKERLLRNQEIQKIRNSEADNNFIFKNSNAKPYHTAGMKVLQADGSTYIYGKTVYNTEKIEASFDVSKQSGSNYEGTVHYETALDKNGTQNSDEYVNKIKTPAYAHSYLITSVLSSDYQDLDNNGPTDNDLGTYTKFDYTKPNDTHYVGNYNWRVPYEKNSASYNEGLKTSKKDQRGNYIYGKKELSYLKKIETKTHVAFIDLEKRKDAMDVEGEQGGQGSHAMSCIKSIRLFSKAELAAAYISLETAALNTDNTLKVKPIKTAHFEYNYSLCPNILSNSKIAEISVENSKNLNKNYGKLTLKKVYFTYRSSNMGKYTPYRFDYTDTNPEYNLKASDIWGNYMKNDKNSSLTPTEFPFVEQDKGKAALNTMAWQLKTVILPSGGKLTIQTESDDYKYVQNKKAMQMFKVIGAGSNPTPTSTNNLYTDNKIHNKYIYVKVADKNLTNSEFKQKYLSENINKPIYFRFLLNMTSKTSDFVSGYFEIDKGENDNLINQIEVKDYQVAIPLKFLKLDGISNDKKRLVNPIAKAGWGFGRTYLNRMVYNQREEEVNKTFVTIVGDLVKSIQSMIEVFKSPNGILETQGCAQSFTPSSSWIRLENPDGKKLGGGLRVSKIELSDQWDVMNAVEVTDTNNAIYNEKYGQEYSYVLEDGITSSGVATFEPNASPENPFVEPFYGKDGSYADRISAPKETNYIEKPFGESFFPSPKVTYSRVTVSNLDKSNTHDNGNKALKKHATGKVITEYYTTKDFPTLVEYTNLDIQPTPVDNPLKQLLSVTSINHLTASQGFSIETNDMDGKLKSENVYGEGQSKPISKVEYKYNIDKNGKLDNKLTTINSKGETKIQELGVNYDLINDFNESNSTSTTTGVDGNLASFLLAIFPGFVPMVLPKYAYHESVLRTSTTTKVVHKTAILIEKTAFDLGSKVSTKNLAWDAKTGQILLTQTVNEFDDSYYNFSFPAYWNYENMGLASENVGLKGILTNEGAYFNLQGYSSSISKYFKIGDELVFKDKTKLWVTGYKSNTDKSKIQLMDRSGNSVDASNMPSDLNFTIAKSGNKNLQMASMSSITLMTNPIANNANINNSFSYLDKDTPTKKVINASAVEYSDDWKSQCENGLPNEAGLINSGTTKTNPYLYNLKGNWRAIRSYAYLTGRKNLNTTNSRRDAGYLTYFNPFYSLNNKVWSKDTKNWTFASEITKYSPYGAELENKDALDRYSSAQYGYNYTLPVAVASNAKYGEIGFDGFEDYGIPNPELDALMKPHFSFSQNLNDAASINADKSHTGNNSLAVKPGKAVTFTRKINGCKTNALPTVCKANVIASPSLQTISSGQTTAIALSSTTAGTTFNWTVNQSGLAGATAGTGNSIKQTLTNMGKIPATVTYTITPTLGNCSGKPVQVSINILPQSKNNVYSKIGFSNFGVTEAPLGNNYPDGIGNYKWGYGYADIVLNPNSIEKGDLITIEFQSFSVFSTQPYYQIVYPNYNSSFNALSPYAPKAVTIVYDGINNVLKVILTTPFSKIQSANSQTTSSVSITAVTSTFVSIDNTSNKLQLITPNRGGVTFKFPN